MGNQGRELTMQQFERIAEVCHEANRIYCEAIGDNSQVPWSEASDWQKLSAINGVKFKAENPHASPADQHQAWLNHKQADGWVWGEVKDEFLKQHPCMVPYDELPEAQRVKDKLFATIAFTMLRQIDRVTVDVGLDAEPNSITGFGSGEG